MRVKVDSNWFLYANKLRKSSVDPEVLIEYKGMLSAVIGAMGKRRSVSQTVAMSAFNLAYTLKNFTLAEKARTKWETEMAKRLRTALRHIFDTGRAAC